MKSRYVLALVSLHHDNSDFSGNIYPEVGRLESPDYDKTSDIRNGICGVIGGLDTGWLFNPENCKVLQVDNDDEIVDIDKDHHLVKFHSGLVVYSGDLNSCSSYIKLNSPDSAEI